MAASQEFANRVAEERRIYGRSTGVGANRDVVLPDPDSQAVQLLRSHATSSGGLRSAERVRAMLLIRLNELAADGNGLDPRILEALTDMITEDALPSVREGGSVGTGDLAALATTALVLSGEKPSDPRSRAPPRSVPATHSRSCRATPAYSPTRRWRLPTSTGSHAA